MDEKYIFGLIGGAVGALCSTVFSIVKDLYAEHRARRKEAEYLAIRILCILEAFVDRCIEVAGDSGVDHSDGVTRTSVKSPTLDINIDGVNWKSLPPKLMYETLYLPNMLRETESYINGVFEHDGPPDYSAGFETRKLEYSRLGLYALRTAQKFRREFSIKNENFIPWDIENYLIEKISEVEQARENRFARLREMMV